MGDETLSPACAACNEIIDFHEPVQFWELHDGRRYVHTECIRSAIEQARRPASVGDAAEGLRQHFQVIDDALDKVICQQRVERAPLVFWQGSEHAGPWQTQIAVIDAYLELLEAARSALRAALAAP